MKSDGLISVGVSERSSITDYNGNNEPSSRIVRKDGDGHCQKEWVLPSWRKPRVLFDRTLLIGRTTSFITM